MNAQLRQSQTPHRAVCAPISFADVIDEVSKLAASPHEAALVIASLLQQRRIRFAENFDTRRLAL